jgi:hypothetical protein
MISGIGAFEQGILVVFAPHRTRKGIRLFALFAFRS